MHLSKKAERASLAHSSFVFIKFSGSLPDVSSQASAVGASTAFRKGRAHQKGDLFRLTLASTFAASQRGTQRGSRFDFSMEAPMEQLEFPLLARVDGAHVVPAYYVKRCKTFREAVHMCWALRRVHLMTHRQLAAEAGLRPQLVSDYLHPDNQAFRRDLPGDRINAFQAVCGNTLVTQWLAMRDALTVLEEMQASRAVA
jgi:hypothetical protein